MKRTLFLIVFAALCSACDTGVDPSPSPELKLTPIKMEETDNARELVYDASGKIAELWIISRYPNDVETKSIQTMKYDNGLLVESTTDTGWKVVYSYDANNRISESEEYVNGSWSQLHTYFYNSKGLLKESITYQNIPEEGGIIPVAKDSYTYDKNDNVTEQKLFFYSSFGETETLLTTITYSDYDNHINSEEYFDIHPFNPLITLRKNNPGKMVVRNRLGIISSVEQYTYQYKNGYATEKGTEVTFHNGNTGSFSTKYFFKE